MSATAAADPTSPRCSAPAGRPVSAASTRCGGGTYALHVGGVEIAAQATGVAAGAAGSIDAAAIDAALTGNTAATRALASANITFSGHAADGTLVFIERRRQQHRRRRGRHRAVTGGLANGGTANTGFNHHLRQRHHARFRRRPARSPSAAPIRPPRGLGGRHRRRLYRRRLSRPDADAASGTWSSTAATIRCRDHAAINKGISASPPASCRTAVPAPTPPPTTWC